jgi:para-aminobenzoate synthetase
MAVAHRDKPIWGVQFHPESISTEYGRLILSNFIDMAASRRREILPRTASQTCSESKAPAAPCFSSPVRREARRKVFVRRLHSSLKSEDVFQTLFGGAEIAIWLDSAKTTDLGCGRFSIMTGGKRSSFEIIQYDASSQAIVSHRNDKAEQTSGDLFTYLKRRIADDRLNEDDLPFSFACGFIGFVGYEMKGCCGSRLIHHSEFPDAVFVYVDRCIVIDHSKGDIYLLYLEYGDNGSRVETWFAQMIDSLGNIKTAPAICDTNTISFTACQNRDKYLQRIASCLQYIRDGESYEICLTNRLTAATEVEPLAYYFGLRSLNPAPFGAFLRLQAVSIACSSPERFLSVTADGVVETKPIKGTCRRGRTPDEDEALRQFLSSDIKSRAENLMIVDLLRNDLGRSCEPGTVTVPKLMHVETFATVHQLVTTVRGQLRNAMTAVDCLRLAFPGGSMTGAPKMRTMDIIDQLECHARGVYAGCIGYFSLNGSADFNIVIRTAVFSDKKVSIGVGGAITAMSDPSQEWDEIMLKGEVLLRAFGDCKVR